MIPLHRLTYLYNKRDIHVQNNIRLIIIVIIMIKDNNRRLIKAPVYIIKRSGTG